MYTRTHSGLFNDIGRLPNPVEELLAARNYVDVSRVKRGSRWLHQPCLYVTTACVIIKIKEGRRGGGEGGREGRREGGGRDRRVGGRTERREEGEGEKFLFM